MCELLLTYAKLVLLTGGTHLVLELIVILWAPVVVDPKLSKYGIVRFPVKRLRLPDKDRVKRLRHRSMVHWCQEIPTCYGRCTTVDSNVSVNETSHTAAVCHVQLAAKRPSLPDCHKHKQQGMFLSNSQHTDWLYL